MVKSRTEIYHQRRSIDRDQTACSRLGDQTGGCGEISQQVVEVWPGTDGLLDCHFARCRCDPSRRRCDSWDHLKDRHRWLHQRDFRAHCRSFRGSQSRYRGLLCVHQQQGRGERAEAGCQWHGQRLFFGHRVQRSTEHRQERFRHRRRLFIARRCRATGHRCGQAPRHHRGTEPDALWRPESLLSHSGGHRR